MLFFYFLILSLYHLVNESQYWFYFQLNHLISFQKELNMQYKLIMVQNSKDRLHTLLNVAYLNGRKEENFICISKKKIE